MTTLEQSIIAAEKRVAKRDARFNQRVTKRSRKGKWDDASEKLWAVGSSWNAQNSAGHMGKEGELK